MTAEDWPEWADPQPMLGLLRGKASERKLRLFLAACCRRGRSLNRSKSALAVLEALELYAEGLIDRSEMEKRREAWHKRFDYPFPRAGTWNSALAYATLSHKVAAIEGIELACLAAAKPERERAFQARLLRDILGDPFKPELRDPRWLTADVIGLALGIYEQRAFDRLPILADALQDAGCENVEILKHCCDAGLHVRGCWVVDLLLGKE